MTSLADSGPGSLRQALADAADRDRIEFSVTGTITLTSGQLVIARPVAIVGPGANPLIISGNHKLRVFEITASWGKVVFANLTIANGNAGTGTGGGINSPTGPAISLFSCTVSDNAAPNSSGGGINNGSNVFNIDNSTISNNHCSGSGGAVRNVGGLYITNSTLTANEAGTGGGISNDGFSRLTNTIVADNFAPDGPDLQGNFSSPYGSNLIGRSDGSTGFINGLNGDQVGTTILPLDPVLGPLADNGGPTWTHALLPGSPAINAGNAKEAFPTDQRGYLRSGASDIGAFELNGAAPVPDVVGAVSRQIHGGAGAFDIDLPLDGPAGIECRLGTERGNYQVVVTFARPVPIGGVSVTSADGLASAKATVSGAVVTLDLGMVANGQTLGITLNSVTDGTTVGDILVPMGVLAGDTDQTGSVTASDVGQTKARSNQPVSASNFRSDVNVSGSSINASDIAAVKAAAGTILP